MFSAIGASGVFVSSGLVAWQVYQSQQGQQQVVEVKQKMLLEGLNKTQFVAIPKELNDKFIHSNELKKTLRYEAKEDLKSLNHGKTHEICDILGHSGPF